MFRTGRTAVISSRWFRVLRKLTLKKLYVHAMLFLHSLRLWVLRLAGAKFVTSPSGVKLTSNFGDRTFQYATARAWGWAGGSYSRHLKSIREPFAYIDVGANQGSFSILAAKNPNCSKVYAFEPIAATASLLKKNIELNNVVGKCVVTQKAVSSLDGSSRMQLSTGHSGAARVITSDSAKEAEEKAASDLEDVICMTREGISRLLGSSAEKFSLKIDVEGLDLEVLGEFLESSISKDIFEVFIEIDSRWIGELAVVSILEEFGFKTFKRLGGDREHYNLFCSK